MVDNELETTDATIRPMSSMDELGTNGDGSFRMVDEGAVLCQAVDINEAN